MKKLLLILLFAPLVSFGQVQQQATQVNLRSSTTNIKQRELVVTEPTTNVKVPITVDFNDYTHLAMVDFKSLTLKPKALYKLYAERLSSTPLVLLNPFVVNKKLAKKDKTF